MKFEKVLLRRFYDTGVKFGTLIPHVQNDYIFENVSGDKAKSLLDKAVSMADSIPVHGNKRPLIVGVIVDDEVMSVDEIKDYMQSYGLSRIEFCKNKRIAIKSKDGELVFENIADLMKDRKNYDYIDQFLNTTKTKYVRSKESFLCKDESGKKEFRKLVLKAEVRLQIIKDEYLDVFPPTPDQDDV